MSWLGSATTIQCSGVSSNAVLDLNAESVNVSLKNNVNDNYCLDRYSLPNSEIDVLGPNNRRFDVRGYINMDNVGTNKITVSGLYQLVSCGSFPAWFYDEALCQYNSTSGLWVRPENLSIDRTNDNTRAKHMVGYTVRYNLSLIETVR